jgi:HPt (histidine-containing phosphotransfer) domain-containing protein
MSADTSRAFAALHASNEFLLALHVQRTAYLRALPAKVDMIEALWSAFLRDGRDEGRLEEAERHAHSIAGSAGTFGLQELSLKGRVLELLLQDLAGYEGKAPAEDNARIAIAIASIRSTVQRECPSEMEFA